MKPPNPPSDPEKEDVVDFANFPTVPPLVLESSCLDVIGTKRGILPLPTLAVKLGG